jgi:hypothetical protein
MDGWDKFLGQALAPFVLLAMLLIARPIVLLVKRYLPEGKLKRFLFIRW